MNTLLYARVQCAKNITEFQRKVYLELLKVPAGETITYGELARRIGCKSAQAVGQALKKNPFAPDVPCHRVVAKGGGIGGYFGKTDGEMIELKRKLLEEEQRDNSSVNKVTSNSKPCDEQKDVFQEHEIQGHFHRL